METVLNMFENLAKPFGKGEGEKEKALLEVFEDAGIEARYVNGVGIIVPEKGEYADRIIVSHIDLVSNFNKGFGEGKTFKIVDDRMYGGLDNTITNACLALAIVELRSQGLAENVRFLFTEGEETGLTGMRNYMNMESSLKETALFINLDVTNDNWGCVASIEFDRPNSLICKQIHDNIANSGFTTFRFTDDTSAILGMGGQGFSYCIPTEHYCHSYESNCLVDTIEPYYKGLLYLIDKLDVSSFECDLEGSGDNYVFQSLFAMMNGESVAG